MNEARKEAGCTHWEAPLNDGALTEAAQAWSWAISTGEETPGHSGPGWYESFGWEDGRRENIALGCPSNAEDAFRGWNQSPRHKTNIMTCRENTTQEWGIGIGRGGCMWTLAIADHRIR
jgi:uncharacterized protein YkwD